MAALSHFLNLDLVLKSNTECSALIGHLDQSVFVLHHQEHDQQYLLVQEVNGTDNNDPISCTERFPMLIESVPDAARKVWDGCRSRTFSYGFEGGCDFPALDTTISTDLLLRIAKLGAEIGITVYPFRPNDPSEAPQTEAT